MSKVEWNAEPLLRAIRDEGLRRVREAAALGARRAKEGMLHLDYPSPPYGYPRVDTGWLRQNITFEAEATERAVTGRFGVLGSLPGGRPLDYALYLERGTRHMAPRPWLTLTINACVGDWQRIMGVA